MGVEGVIFDIFWGEVEKSPEEYDFSKYINLLEDISENDLRAQIILSFHASFESNNFIDLPPFV